MSKPSLVTGLTTPALRTETIGQALEFAARTWPGQEALVSVHQGVRLSYAQLNARADKIGAGLLALGLKRGDRVGIWSPNKAEWALIQFATAKAGMILVNINPAYRSSELEYTLNKVQISALVAAESFKSSNYVEIVESLLPEVAGHVGPLQAAAAPALRHVIKIGGEPRAGWRLFDEIETFATAAHEHELADIGQQLDCHDPINIQFTSGTTGLPKGATLSHHNILNNGFFVGECVGLRAGDRLCIPVPLYHCFGMVMGNLGCLTHGAAMVYPSDAFDPLAVLQCIATERCTAVYGVPTMFIAELTHPQFSSFDLSSLRSGCMAGSPCPVDIMRQVIDKMHMAGVTIAYGMTETSPVSFQTAADDDLESRVSSIGRVQPHLQCKVIDAGGRVVPRGTPGELCTKGYSVMLGYWGDEQKTAEAIDAEGWMHTGDLVVIDERGYGNVVGRLKDMVIRGGENIYPREIEEFLYKHPAVRDVSVVGVPDEKFGEELCAWVILKEGTSAEVTPESIRAFCQGKIAHYKVPRYVRFVTELPMTVTGKIQKYEIRKRMMAQLGLDEQKTA
ncbi:AMP-binding protein [Castellaniella caeni]|uniref:AMP-binding protein n=1 Tax=Castellaniella caeni TaxID=266123 RepID=UPI00082EDEA1|nr:AMP-binding protein [Castellaniella caeni]